MRKQLEREINEALGYIYKNFQGDSCSHSFSIGEGKAACALALAKEGKEYSLNLSVMWKGPDDELYVATCCPQWGKAKEILRYLRDEETGKKLCDKAEELLEESI